MKSTHHKIFILLLSGLLLAPAIIFGQDNAPKNEEHTFITRGKSLDFALQKLVNQTDLDLIYDPKLISDQVVYVAAEDETPEQILRLILEDSGLDFIQLSSGTYVLIKDNRQETSHGHLSGKVVDKVTGKPLQGAHIRLADATTGTSTNSSGYFNIPKLKPGQHEVTVTYVGYRSVKDTVWVPTGNPSQQNFSLETQAVWVEPIIVSDTQKRLPAADAFTSTVEDPTHRALGTVDAVKSMNAMMGINFKLGLADYNIQGGNTAENELRLDGVPVYNPVSMGRLIGAFSPYAIGNIEVNKAGYGTPVGSQLSGVINLNHKLGSQKEQSYLLQGDPLNLNGRYDHQFNLDDGPTINLMVAGRANIWRWYEKPNLSNTFKEWDQVDPLLTNSLLDISSTDMNYLQDDHQSDIHYSDLHLAASVEHNSFQTTHISAYRGKNYLETGLFSQNVALASDAPNYISTLDKYEWTNMMGKIAHEWLISPRLDASISGYMTKHELNHQYAMGDDLNTNLSFASADPVSDQLRTGAIRSMDTGDENGVVESAVSAKFNYSATKNYQLKTGLKATHLNYRFRLSDLYLNTAQSKSTSFLLSAFAQNNFHLSHKTSLSAGSRFTFVPSRDLVFAEPRLSLQHDEPETAIGYLSAKISGGIYRQFINQLDVSNIGPSALVPSIRFWVPIDYSTEVPKAYHLAGNILWEPAEDWTIKSESYYKWMPTTLSLNYNQLIYESGFGPQNLGQQVQYITSSKQYSYGTGLSIEKVLPSLQMHLKGEYQYSISRQRIPVRFDGDFEPAPWSQPHQLNFSAEWQAFPNLMAMIQWQSIWGRSWGFRKAYYDYLALNTIQNFGDYSFDNPSADRLPTFHQLDAGFSYKISVGSSDLSLRINVLNLLDHKNVLNWWLSPSEDSNGEKTYSLNKRTLPGFSPSFSIKGTF